MNFNMRGIGTFKIDFLIGRNGDVNRCYRDFIPYGSVYNLSDLTKKYACKVCPSYQYGVSKRGGS